MKSSMVNRLELPEGEEEERKGVMYVGHLPYGFIEEGLKDYFSQYGKVTNVKLGRSKKVKILPYFSPKISFSIFL